MASSYSTRLRLEKQGDGDNANTWGARLNTNVIDMVDEAVGGVVVVSTTGGSTTLSANDGSADQSRNAVLRFEGTLGSAATIIIPSAEKTYYVDNATSGAYALTLRTAVTNAGTAVPQGGKMAIYSNGVNTRAALDNTGIGSYPTTGGTINGNVKVSGTVTATSYTGSRITVTSIGASTIDTTNLFATTALVVSATTAKGKQLRLTGAAIADIVSLTDATSITVNLNDAQNFEVKLGGSRTLAAPTNVQAGQTGSFFIVQDGTGSRTLSFNSIYDFPAATAPTLSTSADAVDRLDYIVRTSSSIHMVASLNVS